MTCRVIAVGGITAIACGPPRKPKRCGALGCAAPAQFLCDWKLSDGATCDRPVCARHAEQVAENRHLCPEHQEAWRAWKAQRGRP